MNLSRDFWTVWDWMATFEARRLISFKGLWICSPHFGQHLNWLSPHLPTLVRHGTWFCNYQHFPLLNFVPSCESIAGELLEENLEQYFVVEEELLWSLQAYSQSYFSDVLETSRGRATGISPDTYHNFFQQQQFAVFGLKFKSPINNQRNIKKGVRETI